MICIPVSQLGQYYGHRIMALADIPMSGYVIKASGKHAVKVQTLHRGLTMESLCTPGCVAQIEEGDACPKGGQRGVAAKDLHAYIGHYVTAVGERSVQGALMEVRKGQQLVRFTLAGRGVKVTCSCQPWCAITLVQEADRGADAAAPASPEP